MNLLDKLIPLDKWRAEAWRRRKEIEARPGYKPLTRDDYKRIDVIYESKKNNGDEQK